METTRTYIVHHDREVARQIGTPSIPRADVLLALPVHEGGTRLGVYTVTHETVGIELKSVFVVRLDGGLVDIPSRSGMVQTPGIFRNAADAMSAALDRAGWPNTVD